MYKAKVKPEEVVIRPADAVDADVDGMCELLQDLFVIERDFSPDWEKQRAGLDLLLSRPDCHAIVAIYQDKVIGMCTIQALISTAEGGKVGLVEDVVVSRPYRRNGIGKRLLQAAVEWATAQKMSRLQLLSDQNNRSAVEFYNAVGWSTTNMICRRLSSLPE